MKDDQALRWLREASEAISRGHAISADELLSDMVVSLGERGLAVIKNKGNAYQLARWRLVDWKRGLRPQVWDPEQPTHVEPVEPETPVEVLDLGDLALWRRRFEREALLRGQRVHLSDRRVKELLRQRAKALTEADPEIGLALLGIASEPTAVSSRRGPVARRRA